MTNPEDSAHPWKGIGIGLTKREWFAGMALASIRAEVFDCNKHDERFMQVRSYWCVQQADALLKALNEGSK